MAKRKSFWENPKNIPPIKRTNPGNNDDLSGITAGITASSSDGNKKKPNKQKSTGSSTGTNKGSKTSRSKRKRAKSHTVYYPDGFDELIDEIAHKLKTTKSGAYVFAVRYLFIELTK